MTSLRILMVIIPLVAETGEDAQNSTLLTCKTREFSLLAEAMSRRTCLATRRSPDGAAYGLHGSGSAMRNSCDGEQDKREINGNVEYQWSYE